MTIEHAMNILKPSANTAEALKTAYRQLSKQFHPDVNPLGEEMMKMINLAYEVLCDRLGEWEVIIVGDPQEDILIKISTILLKCRELDGLNFEICGNWLWITGETYTHRSALKGFGLSFAPKKKAWYWKPSDYKKRSRREWDLEEIRNTWGKQDLSQENRVVFAG